MCQWNKANVLEMAAIKWILVTVTNVIKNFYHTQKGPHFLRICIKVIRLRTNLPWCLAQVGICTLVVVGVVLHAKPWSEVKQWNPKLCPLHFRQWNGNVHDNSNVRKLSGFCLLSWEKWGNWVGFKMLWLWFQWDEWVFFSLSPCICQFAFLQLCQ